jgi:uncharacterized membrane protein
MMGGLDGMMDGNMMAGWGAYGLAGGLMNMLLLGGLLGVAAWVSVSVLANQRQRSVSYANRTLPAEEVLRERFARGEIGADDYARCLRTLQREPAHGTHED